MNLSGEDIIDEEIKAMQNDLDTFSFMLSEFGTPNDNDALRQKVFETKSLLADQEQSISSRLKIDVSGDDFNRHAELEDAFFEVKSNYYSLLSLLNVKQSNFPIPTSSTSSFESLPLPSQPIQQSSQPNPYDQSSISQSSNPFAQQPQFEQYSQPQIQPTYQSLNQPQYNQLSNPYEQSPYNQPSNPFEPSLYNQPINPYEQPSFNQPQYNQPTNPYEQSPYNQPSNPFATPYATNPFDQPQYQSSLPQSPPIARFDSFNHFSTEIN